MNDNYDINLPQSIDVPFVRGFLRPWSFFIFKGLADQPVEALPDSLAGFPSAGLHSNWLFQGVEAKKIMDIFLEQIPLVLLGEEDQGRQWFQPYDFPELLTGIFELIFFGTVNDIDEGLGVPKVGKSVTKGGSLWAKIDKCDIFFMVVDSLDVEAVGGYGLLELLMLSKLEEDSCFTRLLQAHNQDFRSVPTHFLSLPRATAGPHPWLLFLTISGEVEDDKSSNGIIMINNEIILIYVLTYSYLYRESRGNDSGVGQQYWCQQY